MTTINASQMSNQMWIYSSLLRDNYEQLCKEDSEEIAQGTCVFRTVVCICGSRSIRWSDYATWDST